MLVVDQLQRSIMKSPISNHCQWQLQLSRGSSRSVSLGVGGGCCRSVSFSDGRSPPLSSLRPPRVAPMTVKSPSPDLSPIPPLHSLSSSSPRPWLLFSSSYFENLDRNQDLLNHYPYCFVSPAENKTFRLDKTQVPSQMRLPWDNEFYFPDDTEFCCTSSSGWILIVHPRTQQMYLINPLFPSDSIVPLPPIHTFDTTVVAGYVSKPIHWSYNHNLDLKNEYICWKHSSGFPSPYPTNHSEMKHVAIRKLTLYPTVAMSSVPSDPTCIVLVLNLGRLRFWRPGHKSWHPPNASSYYHSAVYSNTHKCFYLIQEDKKSRKMNVDVWIWDSDSSQPRMTSHFEVSSPNIPNKYFHWLVSHDLVESLSGDLLLVKRCYLHGEDPFEENPPSLEFHVFKLNREKLEWEEVNSLGGEGSALLMGTSYCLCVSVADYPEFKPNCIYYNSDEPNAITSGSVFVFVFNMENGTLHPYFSMPGHCNCCAEEKSFLWFLPNPNS